MALESTILFDRIINVKLRQYTTGTEASTNDAGFVTEQELETVNDLQQIIIKCPDAGPKPDIQFQILGVQGGTAVLATLTLTNVSFEINPDTFRECEVECGYRNAGGLGESITQVYLCQILWGYIEKPNPDGKIVFWCAVGANIQDTITPCFCRVQFNTDTVTLKEFCDKMAEGLQMHLDLDVEEEVENLELAVNKKTVSAGSKYGLLVWWRTFMEGLALGENPPIKARAGTNEPYRVDFTWDQENIVIRLRNYHSSVLSQLVIDLNYVSSASIVGSGYLTVIAPYNPKLRPGMLFTMTNKFFKGEASPNTARTFTDSKDSLYQANLITINFSTLGANEMKVEANAVLVEDINEETGLILCEEHNPCKNARRRYLTEEDPSASSLTIDIGEGETITLSDYTWMGGGDKYLVRTGDQYVKLANEWFPDIHYKKENCELLPGTTMPPDGYTGAYFWPTIYFATLYQKQNDSTYFASTTNPLLLQPDTYVAKPSWTDPDSIDSGADIFNAAADMMTRLWQDLLSRPEGLISDQYNLIQDFKQIALFMETEE